MADVRFIKARGNSRRRDSRSRTPYEARPGDLCLGLAREVGALGVQPGRSTESLAGARTVDYSHARGSVQSGDALSMAMSGSSHRPGSGTLTDDAVRT